MSSIFDRKKKSYFEEKVMGDRWIRLAYGSPWGLRLTDRFFSRPSVSRWFGRLQDTRWSAQRISNFVQEFKIPMEEFDAREYRSFNDFFKRRFKPGARVFALDGRLPAFAEGRYLVAKDLPLHGSLKIKNFELKIADLIADSRYATQFEGCTAFVARLCPVDYHRFHFMDGGVLLEQFVRQGPLHSVNPEALQRKPNILFTNQRQVSCLKTEHFSEVMMIEVGALFVGAIHQQPLRDGSFCRGDEKGWFEFGGSTVILLTQKDKVEADSDLIERSANGIETLIRLGEGIASAKRAVAG